MYDGILLLGKVINEQTDIRQIISLNFAAVKNKPNVYFLLFDEYPGYKSLADSFNFKNDIFYNNLKTDGFSILPIFSNYNMTSFSMSSILNMQYISEIQDPLMIHQNDVQARSKEIKNGNVFKAFSQMGYRINNYSLFDVQNHKSLGGNSFILGHSRLLTDKLFHNRLIKDIGWIFLTGKYASPIFQHFYFGDIKYYNEKVAESLDRIDLKNHKESQFTYAHFLIPHQPYFYDSTGKPNPLKNLEDDITLRNKEIFLSYLKFCNKQILLLEKKIKHNDPSSIIILMSDHGFRYYNNSKIFEPLNFDNFCAIRNLEVRNNLSDHISNVNLFRYIFNTNFNQRLPYLKDSICVLKEANP
ncbi:MAG: LTA synthase family protein [Ferruginibacter sp.]|nr:LTA synthase family protein [Ferruginibacter sp.]